MDANTNSVVPLFTPYKLGRFDLSHRIVFPALTRNRAHNNIPQQPHATEYYAQRATNRGLLISEAAAASDISQGCPNMPGIWSEEQVEAWKPVVEGVHEKGGFDGIEINAASGYLIDQFNIDASIEDRCRLALEIVEAVVKEIGADKVGMKLSPFSDYDGKEKDSNPEAVAIYMANELTKFDVLYLHVVEPREAAKGLLPIRKAFQGTLIASGGYNKSDGDNTIEENYADLISFGRMFLANPDLPKRFEVNAPLNKYNRSTFYTNDPIIGYTDYPSLEVIAS